MRKKKEKKINNTPSWMITYSDLVTLLLCFFVLLFSFSEINAQKFQVIMSSFQNSLGILDGGKTIDESELTNLNRLIEDKTSVGKQEIEDFKRFKDLIDEYAKERGLDTKIHVELEERGLLIRFMDSVFFDPDDAEIKPESKKILSFIGDILNRDEFADKHIKVEGHTDNVPTFKYETNWELSAMRATNALRYLVEKENVKGDRISSAGYSYYRPIASNDTAEGRAKNRRVDIIILKSSYGKWEPN